MFNVRLPELPEARQTSDLKITFKINNLNQLVRLARPFNKINKNRYIHPKLESSFQIPLASLARTSELKEMQ